MVVCRLGHEVLIGNKMNKVAYSGRMEDSRGRKKQGIEKFQKPPATPRFLCFVDYSNFVELNYEKAARKGQTRVWVLQQGGCFLLSHALARAIFFKISSVYRLWFSTLWRFSNPMTNGRTRPFRATQEWEKLLGAHSQKFTGLAFNFLTPHRLTPFLICNPNDKTVQIQHKGVWVRSVCSRGVDGIWFGKKPLFVVFVSSVKNERDNGTGGFLSLLRFCSFENADRYAWHISAGSSWRDCRLHVSKETTRETVSTDGDTRALGKPRSPCSLLRQSRVLANLKLSLRYCVFVFFFGLFVFWYQCMLSSVSFSRRPKQSHSLLRISDLFRVFIRQTGEIKGNLSDERSERVAGPEAAQRQSMRVGMELLLPVGTRAPRWPIPAHRDHKALKGKMCLHLSGR